VVADDRELLAVAELALGDRQVPRRALERLPGVEALVDAAAQRAQAASTHDPAAPLGPRDLAGQPRAALGVDAHVEQVRAGLGEDLGQAGRVLGPPARASGYPALSR
jgi:hypothetical protein